MAEQSSRAGQDVLDRLRRRRRSTSCPSARLVAERFATDHHELIVEPDAVELLPKLVRHYGEPFADSSAIPSFYLAEMTREHVTVALNGDGGDESFAGYQRYASNVLAARLERLPAPLRQAVASASGELGEGRDPRAWSSRVAALCQPPAGRAPRALPTPGERLRQRGATGALHAGARRWASTPPTRSGSCSTPGEKPAVPRLLDQLLEVDAGVYLPGDLLAKIDIATMAYSLEARSPLLDHELMELAASLPPEQKASGAERKIALRRALRGWVPDAILDGPKQGFELPVANWLRTDLAPYAREVLLDRQSAERGWTRPRRLNGLSTSTSPEPSDHGRKLWALLTLELWAQSSAEAAPEPLSAAA